MLLAVATTKTGDLFSASQLIPLARTAQDQIQMLQDWAATGKVRMASRQGTHPTR